MNKCLPVILFFAFIWLWGCNKRAPEPIPEPVYSHPGVLISADDIIRMKNLIGSSTSPVIETYNALASHPYSNPNYTLKGPFEYLNRDNGGNGTAHETDFAAAWFQALRWSVDGTLECAEKSLDILYTYSKTIKGFEDDANDSPLCAGFDGYSIAKTAELLRYTGYLEATSDEDAALKLDAVDTMLRRVFVPMLDWFYDQKAYANGNWGAVITRAYMAIAIHLNDKDMFQKARKFFFEGEDNGCIKHYILSPSGQCQESGRDQRHTQLGLGALAETCELAYKQGDSSLYSAYENLLLKGFEYTALYNSGITVPFIPWAGDYGSESWNTISSSGRGEFLPYYEVVYNHYVYRHRMITDASFVTHVLFEEGARPEVGLSSSVIQFTFGSMLYFQSN